MKNKACFFLLLLGALLLLGCGETPPIPITVTPAPAETAAIASTPAAPEETPAPTPVPTPEPTPTLEPTPQAATIGFAGDILMMEVQINNAKRPDGSYDFTGSFLPMAALFAETDMVCVNFEGALAGEEAGYSKPRPTAPPPTEADPTPKAPFQSFNSPDSLADALFAMGVDYASTANNHCLDRGYEGLLATAACLRRTGMMQGGTYISEEDRFTPRIMDVNGIKVGIISAAQGLNSNDGKIPSEARSFAVTRLTKNEELLQKEFTLCREQGAEFIIAFVHWGVEFEAAENRTQQKQAEMLIGMGADAIIGSHPHVVQPIRWVEAERDGQNIRVPVVYSLGNFISNMSKENTRYGMFVRLCLLKELTGEVRCERVEYIPVYTFKQKLTDGRTLHQAVPCYEDPSMAVTAEPMDEDDLEDLQDCRTHVVNTAGTAEDISIIEWSHAYAQ
ncbi:MAG: CapA family protein [Clostridiales bacterium]|nr:CapA family protein [Clostridiales bacterium]